MFKLPSRAAMRNDGQRPAAITASNSDDDEFLVIGGGIAGSTCAVELNRLRPSSKVTIVSPAPVVKTVRGVRHITPSLGVVDVEETSAADFAVAHPQISLVRDAVIHVDYARSQAILAGGGSIPFSRCCVATGASVVHAAVHPRVISIRDQESLEQLSKRLVDAEKVLIVGNGGIALELVHALTTMKSCQVVWAVRDDYIGNTFFDATASAFVLPTMSSLARSPERAPATPKSGGALPSLNAHAKCGRVPAAQSTATSGSREFERSSTCSIKPLRSPQPNVIEQEGHALPTKANRVVGTDGVMHGRQHVSEVQPEANDHKADLREEKAFSGGGLGPNWMEGLETEGQWISAGANPSSRPRPTLYTPTCRVHGGNVRNCVDVGTDSTRLDIQFDCELESIVDGCDGQDTTGKSWPVRVRLTNGAIVGCDFVVSATGVKPNTGVLGAEFERGRDMGLAVDELMRVVLCSDPIAVPEVVDFEINYSVSAERRTASADKCTELGDATQTTIFAAGDCCCLVWPVRESKHWFQMRLWSQARAMGLYTAKCMADSVDELGSAGAFDLFVHATRFFGHKVALLGHFNGQGLGIPTHEFMSRSLLHTEDGDRGYVSSEGTSSEVDRQCPPKRALRDVTSTSSNVADNVTVLVRMTPGVEYVKVILEKGKVRGAILIGDTNLEETFENLILNETDVSHLGADLLSEDIDIEDYFD